ncbi:hypothetical protein C8F04DRAFT_1122245 [Mycena alexandri]|uniref:Uncharacterized protein n=1 Tax=Mycena alexandri TaxID=1745969 RepID=A0AAD6SGE3_9AGAR|nr:hypothetical protein C8F04DRAFT_1122245 [Mycena alexandri]
MAPRITPRTASRAFTCIQIFLACSLLNTFLVYPTNAPLAWIIPQLKVAFGALSLLVAIAVFGALIYYSISPQDGEVTLEVNPDLPIDLPEPPPSDTTLPLGASLLLATVVLMGVVNTHSAFLARASAPTLGRSFETIISLPVLTRILTYEAIIFGGMCIFYYGGIRFCGSAGRRRRLRQRALRNRVGANAQGSPGDPNTNNQAGMAGI